MVYFQPVAVQGARDTVEITGFLFQRKVYIIVTSNILDLFVKEVKEKFDNQYGYTGLAGSYETMLFSDKERITYPQGTLPGHPKLGIFQRYATRKEAIEGHYKFLTLVKTWLLQQQQEKERKNGTA